MSVGGVGVGAVGSVGSTVEEEDGATAVRFERPTAGASFQAKNKSELYY